MLTDYNLNNIFQNQRKFKQQFIDQVDEIINGNQIDGVKVEQIKLNGIDMILFDSFRKGEKEGLIEIEGSVRGLYIQDSKGKFTINLFSDYITSINLVLKVDKRLFREESFIQIDFVFQNVLMMSTCCQDSTLHQNSFNIDTQKSDIFNFIKEVQRKG